MIFLSQLDPCLFDCSYFYCSFKIEVITNNGRFFFQNVLDISSISIQRMVQWFLLLGSGGTKVHFLSLLRFQ